MPKFVVEHQLSGAGKLGPLELEAAARKVCEPMDTQDEVHWIETYASEDTVYCVFYSPDAETLRRLVRSAGVPAGRILPASA